MDNLFANLLIIFLPRLLQNKIIKMEHFKQDPDSEESDNYYDDESDCEEESDLEDFECVVCKLVFSGESRFDHHRRVSQHWG